MRWLRLVLVFALLGLTACAKLQEQRRVGPADLVALDAIPSAYGELVAVTYAPQSTGETGWRELWFENEETGSVTYIPCLLPDWKYDPKLVKSFARP